MQTAIIENNVTPCLANRCNRATSTGWCEGQCKQQPQYTTLLSERRTIFANQWCFEEAYEAIAEAFGSKVATAAALEVAHDEYKTMFENKYYA